MKLVVLVDNNTYIDQYYYGEPAACYYLEDAGTSMLFDVGYSGIFLGNAQTAQVDLTKVSRIIISHGHNDHTGGLPFWFKQYPQQRTTIIAHPQAFAPKLYEGAQVGSPLTMQELQKCSRVVLTQEPFQVSEHIYFLGEIPQVCPFEMQKPLGQCQTSSGWEDDMLVDDSALAYKTPHGIYIITGCSHRGICNIIEQAKNVCGDERVLGIIGGFHLFDVNERLTKTIEYFKAHRIQHLYPCHCVSFAVKAEIHKAIPIGEVGVGLVLDW